MQGNDDGFCESGTERTDEAQGVAAADVRFAQDIHSGETDGSAEGVLSHASPADLPVPPSNILSPGGLGDGAFSFLEPPNTGEQETEREACVGNIKAFVRGGREGLLRLQQVLPSIFKTFPDADPCSVLIECGLSPSMNGKDWSFIFRPDLDGDDMCKPRLAQRKRKLVDEDVELYRSQELMEAFEAARAEWSS